MYEVVARERMIIKVPCKKHTICSELVFFYRYQVTIMDFTSTNTVPRIFFKSVPLTGLTPFPVKILWLVND